MKTALKKVAAPVPRAWKEDLFESLGNGSVPEDRPVSGIRATPSCLLAWLEDALRCQTVNIRILAEYVDVGSFDHVGPVSDSGQETKVVAMIRPFFNQ